MIYGASIPTTHEISSRYKAPAGHLKSAEE